MPAHPPSPVLPPGCHTDLAAALEQNPRLVPVLIAVLQELIDLGMNAVRQIRAQVLHPTGPQAAAKLILAYTRIARTIRRAIALQAQLAAGPTPAAVQRALKSARIGQERLQRETLQRGSVSRTGCENLTDPALTLEGRSLPDLVLEICLGLGLTEKSPTWPAALIRRVSQPMPPPEPEPEPELESEPAPPRPRCAYPTSFRYGEAPPAAAARQNPAPRAHEDSG